MLDALKDLKDPSSGRTMSELGMLKQAEELPGGGVRIHVELPTPASHGKPREREDHIVVHGARDGECDHHGDGHSDRHEPHHQLRL